MTKTPEKASVLFSAALKSLTWNDHEKAEYAEFMQGILSGSLNVQAYADMVAQHYFPYVILEEVAHQMKDDPIGGAFVFDELSRVGALEADLEHLIGPDWRDKIAPNEATKEYCNRLREMAQWPGGWVAHAYTRYLGDMSGGQVIKAAVERAHGFKDGEGVQFYIFKDIEDYKAFKIDYRDRLDSAAWDDEERERVIDEAVYAYQVNTRVLAELGSDIERYHDWRPHQGNGPESVPAHAHA